MLRATYNARKCFAVSKNACEQRHYRQVIQTMKIIVKRLANTSQSIMSVDKKNLNEMFNNKRYGRKRRDLKLRKNLLGYKEIRNGAFIPQTSGYHHLDESMKWVFLCLILLGLRVWAHKSVFR